MKTLSIAVLSVILFASCSKKKDHCYQCVITKSVTTLSGKGISITNDTVIVCESSDQDVANFVAANNTYKTVDTTKVDLQTHCAQNF